MVAACAIGVGLSAIRATFAGTGVLDKVPEVDDAIDTGVGAIEAGVMRLYGVVMILSRWVRGCARLCGVHEDCSFVVRSRGGRRPSPGSMVSC